MRYASFLNIALLLLLTFVILVFLISHKSMSSNHSVWSDSALRSSLKVSNTVGK